MTCDGLGETLIIRKGKAIGEPTMDEVEQNTTENAAEPQAKQSQGVELFLIKTLIKIACFFVIILGVIWWYTGDNLITNPPITIAARCGILSDCVLQVINDSSSRTLEVSVLFRNGDKKSSLRGQTLTPGEKAEFGMLEMIDWRPKKGDEVLVRVAGYARGARVKFLENETFTVTFEYMNYFIFNDP